MSKQKNLFKTKTVPAKPGSGKLWDEEFIVDDKPVTCLGLEFENDDARRAHFTELLREKLKDPEFRKIEGFPIGEDENILKLSDPPYYTACPNPWIADFIAEWEKEKEPRINTNEHQSKENNSCEFVSISGSNAYHREPFAADVSEGKNDPIYNAHSYHTKVPHKAIMRYILHYTEPGDIVFDGFAGTGMTGVAAQMCGDREVVESLGYKVENDGTILQQEIDEDGKTSWVKFSKLGARKAVLNDLSPAATFIAYNYNTPVDVAAFEREAKRILAEVEKECGWMYETLHVEPASSRLIKNIKFEPCNPYEANNITYRKDNLPHIQVSGATYFITFKTHKFRILTDQAKQIILDAILYWNNKRWKIFSVVIMPDHVHLIAKPVEYTSSRLENKSENTQYSAGSTNTVWDISEILHSVKSFSANEINKIEKKHGTYVWQTESYDRVVRDEKELVNVLAYINHNPVKAGLVEHADDYQYRYVADELLTAGWKPAPLGKINYTVWSDVFICPECAGEVVFWEAAVDKEAGKVKDKFPCPHCNAQLTKRKMERAWTTKFDKALNDTIRQAKQVPVLINYTVPGTKGRFEKTPDEFDLALIEKIENSDIPYWFPTDKIPLGVKTGEPIRIGRTYVHHLYTTRNLYIISKLWDRFENNPKGRLSITSVLIKTASLLHNIGFKNGQINLAGALPNAMYIPSNLAERNIFTLIQGKVDDFLRVDFRKIKEHHLISLGSLGADYVGNSAINEIDYIFIDPPFGSNLHYSELSYIWEAWLKLLTNNVFEAIESSAQNKGSAEYRQLMAACFKEAYRVLKPGHWMTVEFSNTKASVWNSIQTALAEAGFLVANVAALDKGQGTFNSQTNPTSVKQDLIISAYKPNGGFEERFETEAQTEEGVWDFVRTHLKYLPVTKKQGIDFIVIPERDPRILYDQVIAYYVRKGYNVPIDSQDFQLGLSQRFSERDGMYFLPEQVAEYDRKKMIGGGRAVQQSLFVSDESSAIEWLRNLLRDKPQSFQDINPKFMQEISGWNKHEKGLELSTLLEQNFLCYDGKGNVPSQIHSHLSTWYKELRNLQKNDPVLIAKAKDRWYVPDPNKAGDLEKLREKALLKEFEEYVGLASSQPHKKLKLFRLEAVRAGFKKAWQERDYQVIITVAEKIPSKILEEDPKLLMWYDQAVTRMGGE